ncbi:hypothetical protein Trydic_g19262 [Trypoxylus dichotomus]
MANNRLLNTQIRRHELPGTRKNVYGKVTPSGSQSLVDNLDEVEKIENSDLEVYLPFLVLQTNMIVILRIQPQSGEKIWYQVLKRVHHGYGNMGLSQRLTPYLQLENRINSFLLANY